MTIFQEMGSRMIKMNITFFMGNGVPNTALKVFPQKPPYWQNESQKNSFEGTFSPVSVVLLDQLFPKQRVYPCVDSHQPCEFHENWFKTATCDSNNYNKLKI